MSAIFIGLMSGTSLDGIDGVLARWADDGPPQVLGFVHHDFAPALRAELLALQSSADGELHRAALASNALALGYAAVVHELLAARGLTAAEVRAVGAHGQTVRHRPGEFDGLGYTCQLLNGALLAERCGIDVVCDLRSRDVAAGGQGAPLVPAFHAACFGSAQASVAVLNIGGIANLSLLPMSGVGSGVVSGFDTGPGNLLMDAWCQQQLGQPFDADGAWAASGRVLPELLARLLAEPYFGRLPPKSTGRDLFGLDWLRARLAGGEAAVDVMATLAELTARSAVDALRRHAPDTRRLLVCGGGAFNRHLLRRLAALAPGWGVDTTVAAGVPPDQVEALAFAWLARRFVAQLPGNLPAVTGAAGPRVLGALYPA
jgi:anhydro-N-acetylmuramic acid kinase